MINIASACGLLCLTTVILAEDVPVEEPMRVWKDTRGRELIGELVACDNIRVTLRAKNNTKVAVPVSRLCEEDRQFIAGWRKEHPQAPWIDPTGMPPWPRAAGTGVVQAKRLPPAKGETGFVYRSPHFQIGSDIELPLLLAGDIATLLEATRIVAHILPLGLAATPRISEQRNQYLRRFPHLLHNPDLLRVELFADENLYAGAGAPPGTGGYYHPRLNRTILSLKNLGIQKNKGLNRIEFRKQEFVLKHEIIHHILHDWNPFLPVWFTEGFAEYLAATPYRQGRYEFVSMDTHLRDYLNKWRFNEDPRRIPIMKTQELMTINSTEWFARLARSTPILEYNSAAVLVHYFIYHDDKGNAAHLAAWLDAIRRGVSPAEAQKKHLLRGRTYSQLDQELRMVWKKKQVTLLSSEEVDPF